MNTLHKILLILSISMVSFSCEKEVVLDFDNDNKRLAIFSIFSPNAIYTNDNNFIVEVSTTQSILDNSTTAYVNDARVTIITEGSAEEEEEETIDTQGDSPGQAIISEEAISYFVEDTKSVIYRTDNTVPSDGFSYKLSVDHPNFPTVTAESYVPKITEIKNLNLRDFKTTKENQLPGNTKYFSQASFELDNSFDQTEQYHLLVWLVYPPTASGIIRRRQITIVEDVLMEQLGADATIVNSSPVFFGAHFDNSNFKEATQNLNFDIEFSLHENEYPTSINIELRSVSEQYHDYFVEGFRLSQAGSNQFFSSPNNISNNIEGGYGVFAGYSVHNEKIRFRK